MVPAGSSFFSVPDRPPPIGEWPGAGPIVVWLWGEHDLSTDGALGATLTGAVAVDSADVVLDLSEVEFMGVSTLRAIVRARELLRQRSRSLTVRAPSARVRRVIDACGWNDLLGTSPEVAGEVSRKALISWVAVPPTQRDGGRPVLYKPAPEGVPARAGLVSILNARATRTGPLEQSG
jgi:anti-anti-sigma factor